MDITSAGRPDASVKVSCRGCGYYIVAFGSDEEAVTVWNNNCKASKKKRICAKCKKGIGKSDKFRHITDEEKTYIEHWDCQDPKSYGGKYK